MPHFEERGYSSSRSLISLLHHFSLGTRHSALFLRSQAPLWAFSFPITHLHFPSMIVRHPNDPTDPRAESMLPAVGGFLTSDRSLFLAGYSELCRIDLTGKRALEICGGFGKLSAALAAVFPQAEVVCLDFYEATGPEID